MGDKQNAARVAWATIKLTLVGQRPVSLDQLATHVGLPVAETARLLRLIWRARVDLRDGMVRLDATPAGPRRYRVHAGGRPVGAGKGCSVDVCAQQLFFASAQAASRWLADHPQGRLIPVRSFHAEARRLVDRLEATPPTTPTP
jgi:hypothetical protein